MGYAWPSCSAKTRTNASPAELVYGTALALPAEFLGGHPDPDSPRDHIKKIGERMADLVPTPTAWHTVPTASEPSALRSADYVFIRRDARRTPLQRPYDGPFKVIERTEKTYKVQMGTRQETVSVDRLKPAIIDPADNFKPPLPPTHGRPQNLPIIAP